MQRGGLDEGRGAGGGTRSARVIESRAPATASRTRTHRTLTVQPDERSQTFAWSGSSLAQIIGAIGPSRARRTSPIVIVSGRSGEFVAAVGATGAHDEAGFAQADDELLEVGAREVLLGGDLGERRRTGPVVPPELDHQAHAVLALRAEGDGAAAVEGRRAAWSPAGWAWSGEALDIRVISSDMSLRGRCSRVNRAREYIDRRSELPRVTRSDPDVNRDRGRRFRHFRQIASESMFDSWIGARRARSSACA